MTKKKLNSTLRELGITIPQDEMVDTLFSDGDTVQLPNDIEDYSFTGGSVDEDEDEPEDVDESDEDEEAYVPTHIIVDSKKLLELFCQFNCSCGRPLTQEDFQFVHSMLATSINYRCRGSCCSKRFASVKAQKVNHRSTSGHLQRSTFGDEKEARNLAIGDYDINRKMVLAMQSIGEGEAAARLITSFLGLSKGGFGRRWVEIEQSIAEEEIILCQEIVAENLEEEKRLSPTFRLNEEEEERPALSVQMDGGWQARGSGRSYRSMSGQHLAVGNRAIKVVSCHAYRTNCIKCKRNICNGGVLCANRNMYDGSAKGMEGQGAADACDDLVSKSCWVKEFVSDDDSTQRSYASRKIQDLIDNGELDEWPRTKSGKSKIACRGRLPYGNGDCKHLADVNHRVRIFKRGLYVLKNKKLQESICCKADCERIARNYAYCLLQNVGKPIEQLQEAMKATVEHHFDNHEYCSTEWCRRKRLIEKKHDGETVASDSHYRCKEKHQELYVQINEVMEWHLSKEALVQLNHKWNTNKCESLMGLITRYLPKVRNYCKTICGSGRLGIAIGVDSVGKERYYERLCERLGLDYWLEFREQMKRRDRRRKVQRNYRSSDVVKKRAAKNRNDLIKELCQTGLKDRRKGREYRPGIALESHQIIGQKRKERTCPHCGEVGHTTKRSKFCKKHHEYTPPEATNGDKVAGGSALDDIPLGDGLPAVAAQKEVNTSSSSMVD